MKSIVIDYIQRGMFLILCGAAGFFWGRLRFVFKKQIAASQGIKVLLKDRIHQAYNYHIGQGFCPIYERENIADMYGEYKALGGNGVVGGLVGELMSLPTVKGDKECTNKSMN